MSDMNGRIQRLREKLNQEKGRLRQLELSIAAKEERLRELDSSLAKIDTAREIARKVAKETQRKLEFRIADLVTLALSSVFEDPYGFSVEFVSRRGKTECDLWFIRDGQKLKPEESSGVGPVDIAAFALRVALWSLGRTRKRNVLILDEPFKHLRGEEYQRKASQMVKEISDELGLQVIMVGDVLFSVAADRTFEVTLEGVSKVRALADV